MRVVDACGSLPSYKLLQDTYNESCHGHLEPAKILAEPKTMEVLLRFMLPFVCDPKWRGYVKIGELEHVSECDPRFGMQINTIAFIFGRAGFGIDEELPKGTLRFKVFGYPQYDSEIINLRVDP